MVGGGRKRGSEREGGKKKKELPSLQELFLLELLTTNPFLWQIRKLKSSREVREVVQRNIHFPGRCGEPLLVRNFQSGHWTRKVKS